MGVLIQRKYIVDEKDRHLVKDSTERLTKKLKKAEPLADSVNESQLKVCLIFFYIITKYF